MNRAYRMLFALVILVFGGWAVLDGSRWYELTYQTQTADGKITKKHSIARPAGTEFRLEYTFTRVDGDAMNGESIVTAAVFERTAEEQPVKVVYLPANPAVERWLFDNDAMRANAMYLTVGHGIAALLAVIVLRVVERPLQRELRLARHGVVAQGQIVSVGKPRGRRGTVRIIYSFHIATGAKMQGACNLPRRFPVHTLEPGAAVDVLYDPRRPRLHKPRLALDFVEFGEAIRKKPKSQ
jgi:hypothetical protein